MLYSLRHKAALLCAAALLQGCASNAALYDARSQFFNGDAQAALSTIKSDEVADRNRLLAHLDHGLIAHTAGNYQESINAFKAAYEFLKQIDFVSIREQSTSLVTNDWSTSYKGEYSEKLWIHTFQMMNFLLIGSPEGAAVEARQALQVYENFGDALKTDWFTRTLIAMSFEAAGKADSAHIEYKKLLQDSKSDIGVARRAWTNARRLGREQDADTFEQLLKLKPRDAKDETATNNQGELILFVQAGSIPKKTTGEIFLEPELYASFPVYPEFDYSNIHIKVMDNALSSSTLPSDIVTTKLIDISRSSLAKRGKKIAAKLAIRMAAKKELARALNERNNGLGDLIGAVMYATEVADTRSWETLPAFTSMVQIPMAAGKHDITLLIKDGSHSHEVSLSNIDIQANQTSYRSIRVGSGAPQLVPVSTASAPAIALPSR